MVCSSPVRFWCVADVWALTLCHMQHTELDEYGYDQQGLIWYVLRRKVWCVADVWELTLCQMQHAE